MAYIYCPTCREKRMFKRHFTIATFIAVLLTAGFWVLAMPFYPKRCITCGYKYEWLPEIKKRTRIRLAIIGAILLFMIIMSQIVR